jgi:hypothetical protein
MRKLSLFRYSRRAADANAHQTREHASENRQAAGSGQEFSEFAREEGEWRVEVDRVVWTERPDLARQD